MKRLLVFTFILSLTIGSVWAEIEQSTVGTQKTVKAKAGESANREKKAESNESSRAKVTLKVYSMNGLLFVDTNSTYPVTILKENGNLEREVTPTGVLMAFPMSRGTYIVRTGELSDKVVVR